MVLLNPTRLVPKGKDNHRHQLMQKTVDWFETKGLAQRMIDDHNAVWYADFISFLKTNQVYAQIFTPKPYGTGDSRWDTSQLTEFGEILGFYGLPYWYTFQVSALGLGPIFCGTNEDKKHHTAKLLAQGEIFGFGLSEKEHGADIYSNTMSLKKVDEGQYLANGSKYYIGNANKAKQLAIFGKLEDTGEYVFFTVDSQHKNFHLIRNTVHSQNFVAEFRLDNYPVSSTDITDLGQAAWDSALNTINICKFNLGFASIGICTHALYEALAHASARCLFKKYVTDFPHIKSLFVDAHSRLVAMKLFSLRATDYMRCANENDRRYLLYNPMVKMKVTTQGEDVIDALWDVIAAKGFEKDQFFCLATRDIRALPKLEGTVHVNMALIVKFMANYFFKPKKFDPVPSMAEVDANDDFLFAQGPTKGLGKISFHDYNLAYRTCDLPNVQAFRKLIKKLKRLLLTAKPSKEQSQDFEFLLLLGQMFTQVVYGQLILENAKLLKVEDDLIDQIFDFMIRDFCGYALKLYSKSNVNPMQKFFLKSMLTSPIPDPARFERIWEDHVYPLKDAYRGNKGDQSLFLHEASKQATKKPSPKGPNKDSTPNNISEL